MLASVAGDKYSYREMDDFTDLIEKALKGVPQASKISRAGVLPENSVRFYLALRKAKVPAEMHIFENGPHGVGLALGDPALGQWPVLLTNWLRARALLARSQ